MIKEIKELAGESRVWIFPSSRKLSVDEMVIISDELTAFLSQWRSHDADMIAAFEFKYDRFIIVYLDETQHEVSGCGIDKLIAIILKFQEQFNIDLLDKMNVTFKQGEFIQYQPLIKFRKLVKDGSVSKKTIVFNNLVNTKEEFEKSWEIPAEMSWHNRYFKK